MTQIPRTPELPELPGVDIDPQRFAGCPCVGGTRFPVSQILAELAEGDVTLTGVAEEFDHDPEAFRGALQWAAAYLNQPFLVRIADITNEGVTFKAWVWEPIDPLEDEPISGPFETREEALADAIEHYDADSEGTVFEVQDMVTYLGVGPIRDTLDGGIHCELLGKPAEFEICINGGQTFFSREGLTAVRDQINQALGEE